MTEKQIRKALELNFRWGEKRFNDFFKDHTGEWTDEDYNRAAQDSERLVICTYEADKPDAPFEEKEDRRCGTCIYHKMDKACGEKYCTCEDCDCYSIHTGTEDGDECPDWERKEKRHDKKSR